jgi:hypothetical protein
MIIASSYNKESCLYFCFTVIIKYQLFKIANCGFYVNFERNPKIKASVWLRYLL